MILFHLVWVKLREVRDGLVPTQVFNEAKPSMVTSALPNLTLNPVHIKWKTPNKIRLSRAQLVRRR